MTEETPPAREPHQCCCVFVGPNGEDACKREADADSPFCIPCQEGGHHTPGFESQLSEGWKVIARIPRPLERKQ